MADVVNLRMARKAKARDAAGANAAANRAKFGQSKAEREGIAQESTRAARLLDGARRDEP